MTVIDVVMHDHKWGSVPQESNYVYCRCGFFRRRSMQGLVELERDELLRLSVRVSERLQAKQNERLSAELRDKGFYIP